MTMAEWIDVKDKVMLWEEMKFEDIMKKKDINAGLNYLRARASTIRQTQIIEMIKAELKKENK